MNSSVEIALSDANDVALGQIERALLEAVTVRDAVLDLGDDDLVLVADALLYGIAQAANRSRRGAHALHHGLASAA